MPNSYETSTKTLENNAHDANLLGRAREGFRRVSYAIDPKLAALLFIGSERTLTFLESEILPPETKLAAGAYIYGKGLVTLLGIWYALERGGEVIRKGTNWVVNRIESYLERRSSSDQRS